MKKIITSKNAPKATGPFSQAVLHNFKYQMEISGQLEIIPSESKLVEGGVAAEMERALKNVAAILAA